MKNEKGFTLIELLAVIIVIGIIAVITIPVVKDSLDEAKISTAKESAYGYIGAVNKYYFDMRLKNQNGDLDGVYFINSNGDLVDDNNSSIFIDVNGKKPSGGNLTIVDNEVVSGCISVGIYSVPIADGTVGDAVKGECEVYHIKPVVYTATFDGSTGERTLSTNPKLITNPLTDLVVGDYVLIGQDGFYVVNSNKGGNIVLLSEYNISNIASENSQPTWKQTSGDDYDKLTFSNTSYFSIYESGEYVYTTDKDENNEYLCNLVEPLENYRSFIGGLIGDGQIEAMRLMTYDEAQELISNSWVYNQSYWLGNKFLTNYGGIIHGIRYVDTSANIYVDYNAWYDGVQGIRPVIEISPSVF